MNYSEVAHLLENFIEGRGGPWDWDDFTNGMKFGDEYIRHIQHRMALLPNEFPTEEPGHYCSAQGIEVIHAYIRELRSRAGCT